MVRRARGWPDRAPDRTRSPPPAPSRRSAAPPRDGLAPAHDDALACPRIMRTPQLVLLGLAAGLAALGLRRPRHHTPRAGARPVGGSGAGARARGARSEARQRGDHRTAGDSPEPARAQASDPRQPERGRDDGDRRRRDRDLQDQLVPAQGRAPAPTARRQEYRRHLGAGVAVGGTARTSTTWARSPPPRTSWCRRCWTISRRCRTSTCRASPSPACPPTASSRCRR